MKELFKSVYFTDPDVAIITLFCIGSVMKCLINTSAKYGRFVEIKIGTLSVLSSKPSK